jgi:hypothetical protein
MRRSVEIKGDKAACDIVEFGIAKRTLWASSNGVRFGCIKRKLCRRTRLLRIRDLVRP